MTRPKYPNPTAYTVTAYRPNGRPLISENAPTLSLAEYRAREIRRDIRDSRGWTPRIEIVDDAGRVWPEP
jgi:hypothetical protein